MLSDKQKAKYQAGAEGMIDPGEQVEAAAWGWESKPSTLQVAAEGLGGLAMAPSRLQKGRIILVTADSVYLAKAKPFSAYKCAEVLHRQPRAGTSASFEGGVLTAGAHTIEIGPNGRYQRAAESVTDSLLEEEVTP